MKAMVLAGGMSTRLYPLTKDVPKPLVPVAGIPNTAYVLRYLRGFGVREAAMNVHYHAGAIVNRFGDGSEFGVALHYLHEPELLGSAGALKQLEEYFSGGTFVVIGCDDLTDFPLDPMLDFHKERGALATIGLVEREDVSHYGVVVLDANGRIAGFQEKPAHGTERSHLVNTGIYIFEPEILARIPEATFFDFGNDVFPALQTSGSAFYGFEQRAAYWCDIGTPEEYRRANADVLNGVFSAAEGPRTDGSARIEPSARIEGPVWIGARATIGAEARIVGPSVIGNGAAVGSGAVLERSILWDGARVGERAFLSDVVVGADSTVQANARVNGELIAGSEAKLAV